MRKPRLAACLNHPCQRRRTHQPWHSPYARPGGHSAVLTRSAVIPLSRFTAGLALGTGCALFATYYFRDQLSHAVAASQRSGRVCLTLLLCINDYRKVLNYDTTDDEQWQPVLKACHRRCAERTLATMEENGSIFIKLGQHLSSLNYLLPIEWTSTFIPLQDHCPVSTFESIEEMFIKDTGQPINETFLDFAKEPVGTASLAQVHLATTRDTKEKVAVKVQHPMLEEWVPLDLDLTKFSFAMLKYFFPQYDMEWLSSEMETSLAQELDFSMEAQHALSTKRHFESMSDSPLVVPDVIWSSKRILVMEYLAGHRPDDLQYLDANDIDRDEVSAALARIFNEMIFGDTPLHCDPHGGNIAIRKNDSRRNHNFDIILYDHGLYRDIPKQLQRDYAKLWLAVIDSDEPRMRDYSFRVAGITHDDFPLFASVVTGRDYLSATKSIKSARSNEEKEHISTALGNGLLPDLVRLLAKVPRVVLLIFKTNDLTRSLDENLQTRLGPARNFMILAHYCSWTVFKERLEIIRGRGRLFNPHNILALMGAWLSFIRVEFKITIYEWWLSLRRFSGSKSISVI